MNSNVWADAEVMAILTDARNKLKSLGVVCEITPAGVPGEVVVAALFVSATSRGLQTGLVAHDVGVDRVASSGPEFLEERIKYRLEDRAIEDATVKGATAH